jgi:hypothetical protein
MRFRQVILAAGLVAVTAAITTQVVSQHDGQMSPEEAKMMQKWMEFMTPGENHKRLDYKVGKWNGDIKMWMSPDQPEPHLSTGTSTYEWILGGRYLKDTTEGSFGGEKFLAHGITAYDNLKKKYVFTWIDNMGTGIMTGEGTYNEANRTFTYQHEHPCLVTDQYIPGRSIERIVDNDTFVYEMYTKAPDGREYRSMEITFRRAKD